VNPLPDNTVTRANSVPKAIALLLFLNLPGFASLEARQSGPTPYPDAKDNAAWPGKGPIRLFDWMSQDRKSFWAKREADRGKIVFVGDSIIGGWKLDKDFPGKPVANRGIGGDVTRGMLFRFQEDVLDLRPKALVIEIGSNDISADSPVDVVVSNYNALLDLAQKADPGTPILILALLPRGIPIGAKAPSPGLLAYLQKVNPRIPLLNKELSKIPAIRKNVTFLDSYVLFLKPDGTLDDALFNDDKVHPTDAGHAKLAGLISSTLTELAK
jgi:lysophospholipase L1-like esterase